MCLAGIGRLDDGRYPVVRRLIEKLMEKANKPPGVDVAVSESASELESQKMGHENEECKTWTRTVDKKFGEYKQRSLSIMGQGAKDVSMGEADKLNDIKASAVVKGGKKAKTKTQKKNEREKQERHREKNLSKKRRSQFSK